MRSGFMSALIIMSLVLGSRTGYGQTVRISYAGISGYNVPLWLTQEAGLFKKYGLDADLILIGGGSTNIQALLANEVRFANLSGSASTQATLQGADVVSIASSFNLMPYSLVVHKDIRVPGDLKGKRMAVSRLGGVTEFAARILFEKFGFGPRDMTFIQVGPDGQRIAAVQSTTVAATIIAPPGLFAAISLGLKVMADLGDLGVKYPTSEVVTTRSYLAQNRSTVRKFLMAFIEGLHLYAQRKELALSVMGKYTKLSDPEVLSKSHDYFIKNTSLVPWTDPIAIKNALPADKAGSHRAEEFYDNSLIQELVNEGFIKNIAKKSR